MQIQPQEINILTDIALPIFLVVLPIIAGAIGGYIGYRRGRTSVFREKIYDKQLEGYSELMIACYDMVRAFDATDFYVVNTVDEMKNYQRNVAAVQYTQLWKVTAKWSIFFSQDVIDEVGLFMSTYSMIYRRGAEDWLENKRMVLDEMLIAYNNIMRCIQEALGTQVLSAELRQYFGEAIEANNQKK